MSGTERFEVRGRVAELSRAADRIVAAAGRRGLGPERVPAAALAVHECLVNAVEHGHLGDQDRRIVVEVAGPAHRAVTVTVTDAAVRGPWHPDAAATGVVGPTPIAPGVDGACDPPKERGRGLVLARAGADGLSVRSEPGVTVVTLRWAEDHGVAPHGPPDPSGQGPTAERR